MTVKFTIPGRLDGLNEYTNANRRNRYAGASMKKKNQNYICACIAEQIPDIKINGPVTLKISWYEPNKRRDIDNIAFAKKFILDALTTCGTIPADNWAGVRGFSDFFAVDKERPRIEVEIEKEKP